MSKNGTGWGVHNFERISEILRPEHKRRKHNRIWKRVVTGRAQEAQKAVDRAERKRLADQRFAEAIGQSTEGQ